MWVGVSKGGFELGLWVGWVVFSEGLISLGRCLGRAWGFIVEGVWLGLFFGGRYFRECCLK